MSGFTHLEREVIDTLLAADQQIFTVLRQQAAVADVREREFTGAGFYTTMAVPATVERANDRTFKFGDVIAEIEGLQHGAGFLLYVRAGALHLLEGYTYDEAWPEEIRGFTLRYVKEPRELLIS